MNGSVPLSAAAVQAGLVSGGVGLLVGALLARTVLTRLGPVALAVRCLSASLVAVGVAAACLIMPRFLIVFGSSAGLAAVRSVIRSLDVPLIVVAALGTWLSLAKTTSLLRARRGGALVVADLAASAGLVMIAVALDRLLWWSRGVLESGGWIGFVSDHKLRLAVLSFPFGASAWAWASMIWVGERKPLRQRLMAGAAVGGAACLWGMLFAPF